LWESIRTVAASQKRVLAEARLRYKLAADADPLA
jgi:hypothetical protein